MQSLYHGYQMLTDMFAPARMAARTTLQLRDEWLGKMGLGDWADTPASRRGFALADLFANATITHARPPYGITEAPFGNNMVPVREEVVLAMPFGNLLHFAKEGVTTPQPKMLVVAPLSGHFATLLVNTVETLLQDHDVYITDWVNARDVPLYAGRFGMDDYIDYVIRFLQEMGPRSHVLAVCQPCVPVLAAVALMAEEKDPAQPRSMTLMGGPIDTRVSPTVVNQLAMDHPLEWFRDKVISTVPFPHKGMGRRVYPGFMQLTAFLAMNPARHFDQHRKLYQHMADGDDAAAAKIRDFYTEYFAVLDLTAEFYLETIDKVFQRALLARGELTYRGDPVNPGAIQRTALLTVEGERDDICAVGQTAAAHMLCTGLRPHLKRHHLQPGVGHYGVFSGSKWERQVYPQVRNLVLAMS